MGRATSRFTKSERRIALSCKARSSAQVSFQGASLVFSLLHCNSNGVWRQSAYVTADCAIPCRKKENNISFKAQQLLGLLFIARTDTNIKRNSQVPCRNASCYSDSIPYFWCSYCRLSYFTVQTLLLSVWQLLSPLQTFSYIFPSFIAWIFRRRAKPKIMFPSLLFPPTRNARHFYLFDSEISFPELPFGSNFIKEHYL